MATWNKIQTDTHRKMMVVTANSKSGYRTSFVSTTRHYWTVPSSYYGYKRNQRTNHLSSGSNEPTNPDNGSIPQTIPYSTPLDYYFEQKFTCKNGGKMKIGWTTSSNQIWDNDSLIYFAPIIIPPDTMDARRWTSHNGSGIVAADYEYLNSEGYGGTSATRGIFKADLGNVAGLTSSDSSYYFGFEFTFDKDTVIEAGSGLLFFVTNDQSTSSSASEYMRNFTVVIEGDVH